LSTALYVTPPERVSKVLTAFAGASALVTRADGIVQRFPVLEVTRRPPVFAG
jgi:hypothetical protein